MGGIAPEVFESFRRFMQKIITRKTCRVCGGKLKELFSLGNLAISTFLKSPKSKIRRAPLDMMICQNHNCELWQLRHTAPQELMFSGHYWYRSGLNSVIVKDLKGIVEECFKIRKPKNTESFLDVGCNDGTLLGFVPKEMYRVGVEPAKNLIDEAIKHADIMYPVFWEKAFLKVRFEYISAIGMFYDSEDPNAFVKNITSHLADSGIFVTQLMVLKTMIEQNDVGNICHEHLLYPSYKSLVCLFERNGLEIFKVEENSINGGSYRIFARHYKNGSIKFKEPEADPKKFFKAILKNRADTSNFIKTEVKGCKLAIFALGASTKGNTILQWYKMNPIYIAGISDKSPEKFGKYTPGTNIRIFSEKAREFADYFWILPYAFAETFMKREREAGYKGKFIISTPKFEIK